MLKISRMKSLLCLGPSLSYTSAAAAPFSRYFHSRPSVLRRTGLELKPLKNPNFLHVISSLADYSKPSNSTRSRGFCTGDVASGEIHVIVGPMFSGKTTTLLKRMKTESTNGRFQGGGPVKNFGRLDKTLRDLCFMGRIKEAVGVLCCTRLQVHPDTYSLLLQECILRRQSKKGRRIHWQMVVVGFTPDEYLKIKLLILICAEGPGRCGLESLSQNETIWLDAGPIYIFICISGMFLFSHPGTGKTSPRHIN